jgi:GT2 family glycosyltransferase
MSTPWPHGALEVVLVDNASSDGVADTVERELPDVRVVRSKENLGFTGGNNLGIGDAQTVDLIALVNSDVTVGPDWLAPLAEVLDNDAELGAASPKMLLDGRYRRVDLSSDAEPKWPADPRDRGVRVFGVNDAGGRVDGVRYVRGFFEPERAGSESFRWTMGEAVLFVPVDDEGAESVDCTLVLDSDHAKSVRVTSGGRTTDLTVQPGRRAYQFALEGETFDVVNNVGSVLLPSGYAADRGWLEPDLGQYDDAVDVFAWCGGAVLLRSEYLLDVGLFDERLFLYYEDLELSWRGRRRGWRYRYVPDSVVRHAHAATAQEGSPLSQYFNERNRMLVLARHASLGEFCSAVFRYLVSTASYVRRDVVAPLLRGARPRLEIVRARLRSLAGFLARVPAQLRDRSITDRSARRPA